MLENWMFSLMTNSRSHLENVFIKDLDHSCRILQNLCLLRLFEIGETTKWYPCLVQRNRLRFRRLGACQHSFLHV